VCGVRGRLQGELGGIVVAAIEDNSLGDDATFAGKASARSQRSDVSLGDERTLGGGDAVGLDTVIDDIEVVDLEARYKIEGTLGQGGMGAVLLATDTRLDRKVAIKRILGEAARSKAAIMRFLTEAKAIAALNHPNIVQIYDYGRAKDGPFLIMEYVDGGSVADLCKQGALPFDRAIAVVCQVCEGLATAHALGIVHRDIKPANILLNRAGAPKLTDFGLAKAEAADHGMTVTGAVMGTPDFMPPEQRRDAALVDHRSDLWSLAATFYQMLTGRSPKIVRLHEAPQALQAILAKALEDEKHDRYQSAAEFHAAIRSATDKPTRRQVTSAAELTAGECPRCHEPNESHRKFCRNPECAASLRVPCLAETCGREIPVWDKVCPECGAKQPELVAAKAKELTASLAIDQKAIGPDHPDTATSHHSLAELYANQGKYDLAAPLYERALTIREKALGLDHPDTVRTRTHLSAMREQRGNPYRQVITRQHRALIIFLLNQSQSMEGLISNDGQRKIDGVTAAMNYWLWGLANICSRDYGFRDLFDVAVIGYRTDEQARPIIEPAMIGPLAGRDIATISEIAENPARIDTVMTFMPDEESGEMLEMPQQMPIWIDPVTRGRAPICSAIVQASELVDAWIAQHPDSAPPIVFNLTDGESLEGDPAPYAVALKRRETSDGNVLFFNCCMSPMVAEPFLFNGDHEALPEGHVRQLFEISSLLPETWLHALSRRGISLEPYARGFACNADLFPVLMGVLSDFADDGF